MSGVTYALFGLLGGFLVEAIEFRRAIHKTKTWPWLDPDEPSFGPWLAAVLVRLAASSGLAFAVAAGEQVSGPFGALTVGIAAPLMIEKLANQTSSRGEASSPAADTAAPLAVAPTRAQAPEPQAPSPVAAQAEGQP